MTKIVYVVSERSFEYNDEYYHLPYDGSGEDCGTAKIVFSDKEKAITLRDQKNLYWLRNTDLGQFGEDGLCSLSYKNNKLLEVLFDKVQIAYDDYEINIPENISDEYCMKILKLIDIAPWIVSEVEYDE